MAPEPPAPLADDVPAETGAVGVRSLGHREEGVARGKVLAAPRPPPDGSDAGWFLDVLTGGPVPSGVHRSAIGDDPLLTLCTTVVNLTAGEITLAARVNSPLTFAADALTVR